MGYDGYSISDNHIYISFDGMRETKSKINHAIEEAKNQRDNISRAIESLQVPDNVLRGYGNDLVAIKNAISKGIDDLSRMSQHIDYVVRRFQEVDNECAISFSRAGYEMQEMLGLARKSGLFEEFVGGLVSATSQGLKASGDILVDGAKDAATHILDWYEDNKVVIGNILNIALETVAIAAAVATIAAGALTPVGWIVIGAGLIVSASNIIDSGVKIYNYQKTGEEKGFNLIEKGFQAVLGDQAGSDAYSVVSIVSGVYNLGKGAVAISKNGVTIVKNLVKAGKSTVEIGKDVAKTLSATASNIASQAKKFYTSVKEHRSDAKIAKNILAETNKLNNVGDTTTVVNKLNDVNDTAKDVGKMGDAAEDIGVVKRTTKSSANLNDVFQKRIDNLRSQMPNIKLKNQGNMAIADVDIPGLKKEFNAHSKIHSADSIGTDVTDFSFTKDNKLFESYVEDKFPRFNDTEAKILEDIASKINDPNISGTINLYTELPACQSCTNIILEFRRKFPNIKLNIFTGE